MKDRFVSKRYWKDRQTPMGKVDELARRTDGVIALSLGDPDITTPRVVIDAALADARAGHTKYTDFRGDPELRAQIADVYKEDFGMDVSDEEIFVAAGGCVAMYLALESVLDDGDEVIMQAPYFTPYKQQVELARGVPVEMPTYEEEMFQLNPGRLRSLVNERTKAVIINTPGNPTGSCQTRETLEAVAAAAKEHDLLVIADDIYTAYSFSAPFIPIASVAGMRERTVTINSASKDFTMTGWRVGAVIAPPNIIKTIQQVNENVMFTAPSVSQRAYIHALRNRKDIKPGMAAEYRARAEYAYRRVCGIKNMSALPPAGTFYMFVNIKRTGLPCEEVCARILREARVVTIPGVSFGVCGEGYIRLACTVNIDTLKEAFDRIAAMPLFADGHE